MSWPSFTHYRIIAVYKFVGIGEVNQCSSTPYQIIAVYK